MGTVMTYKDIEKAFASEWVLLEDPETTSMQEVVRGKVLWHCKDRDELYRKALELRPQHAAIFYTGKMPADMAFIL